MSVGSVEVLFVLLFGLVYLAVPVGSLVLLFLIYDRVKRIERILGQREG